MHFSERILAVKWQMTTVKSLDERPRNTTLRWSSTGALPEPQSREDPGPEVLFANQYLISVPGFKPFG